MFNFLISLLFPEHCPFCNCTIDYKSLFCEECSEEFMWTTKYSICTRCGKVDCICKREPFLERMYVPLFYMGNVKTAIKNFKFNGRKAYARQLAKLISAYIVKETPDYDFDFIVPVPMTEKDIHKRGYNQSEVLAKFIGENLGVPIDSKSLVKIRQTDKQHDLKSAQERHKNLKGAFEVKGDLKGKSVLICDDVITTGSTLKEVSRTLKRHGVSKIYAATIATVPGVEKS